MSKINPDHEVIFFPTFGWFNELTGLWNITINGAVVRPGSPSFTKRMMLRVLRRLMKARPEELESEIFQERIQTFAAVAQRGKRIEVDIGDQTHLVCPRSQRNGHFTGTITLAPGDIADLEDSGDVSQGWLTFRLRSTDLLSQVFQGRAQLIEPTGVSVISDIDDTIKHTAVSNRRELLNNTFLREFTAIDGMSALYQQWAEQGAALHYVSSSPWQLYHPLSAFCGGEMFPNGTMHLRFFRLRDHLMKRMFLIRRRGKSRVIREIVARFPHRRFVLVGDSGELDPEIYTLISHEFPGRVAAIYIRDLPERRLTEERLWKIRARLGDTPLQVFQSPAELPQNLEVESSLLVG